MFGRKMLRVNAKSLDSPRMLNAAFWVAHVRNILSAMHFLPYGWTENANRKTRRGPCSQEWQFGRATGGG